MVSQLYINKADEKLRQRSEEKYSDWDLTTAGCTELGMLYFKGAGGDFNYRLAIKYLNAPGRYTYFGYHELDDRRPKNDAKIARIIPLHAIHFDKLLNYLRADVLKGVSAEAEAAITLFQKLENAASVFVNSNEDLNMAMQTFREACIDAIGDAHQILNSNAWEVRLTKCLGVILSIGTVGVANLVSGRSMYGLLSSKLDKSVKLSELLEKVGYVPVAEATLVKDQEPSAPPFSQSSKN